jgi:excisionase family DNA binding protein
VITQSPTNDTPASLKVGEVARLLSMSPLTIYKLVWSGGRPAIRVGRAVRIDRAAVLALVAKAVPRSSCPSKG